MHLCCKIYFNMYSNVCKILHCTYIPLICKRSFMAKKYNKTIPDIPSVIVFAFIKRIVGKQRCSSDKIRLVICN